MRKVLMLFMAAFLLMTAMALGGGIDWGYGRVGIRAPQIDYFPWRKDGFNFNNFRISGGIVLRLGN